MTVRQTKKAIRNRSRRMTGQCIPEFPLALTIFLLMFFFPLVNMLSLGVSFGCCATLNSLQLRQAALVSQGTSALVVEQVADNWKKIGLGRFAKLTSDPVTKVTYRKGQKDPVSGITDHIVTVETRCSIPPFLSQNYSLLPKAPGLNQPMILAFASERPLENHHNLSN